MLKNILIIDDHLTMVEGYRSILSSSASKYLYTIQTINGCREAYQVLNNPSNHNSFDAVLLDISLPPAEDLKLKSGADLIPIIRKSNPSAKIIVITSHTEHFLIYNLYNDYNPESILIKSDITPNELLHAFSLLFTQNTYYSETVKEAIKQLEGNDFFLDQIDIQIISLIAEGIKNKNLIDYLPLTINAIDKRKARIKQYFLIDKGNDEDIIKAAKKRNFI